MAQPTSAREFLKVAYRRLEVAEFLLRNRYRHDAVYLAGYAIECALKAVILGRTSDADHAETLARITRGATVHTYEGLRPFLKAVGVKVPAPLASRLRKTFWKTELRYESNIPKAGHAKFVIRTATAACDWVDGELT